MRIPDDFTGLGAEAGASLDTLREMYQGFFLAPHVVSQAVKGAFSPRHFSKVTDSRHRRITLKENRPNSVSILSKC